MFSFQDHAFPSPPTDTCDDDDDGKQQRPVPTSRVAIVPVRYKGEPRRGVTKEAEERKASERRAARECQASAGRGVPAEECH